MVIKAVIFMPTVTPLQKINKVKNFGGRFVEIESALHTVTLGLTVSSSLSATATSLVLSGSASGTIEAGQVLLIGTEQVYVRTGGGASGTAVTVQRGVNGATAAVIASGSAIAAYRYPDAITQAALMHAGRIFKRSQAAFASEAGAPDGQITVFQGGMDRDVRMLIDGYKRPALLGIGI